MPPMCTPEKNKEAGSNKEIDDLYFNPRDESISDFSDSDDDEEAKDRMDKLLKDFPDLDNWFELHGQVGEGTFSTVYVAALKSQKGTDKRYAVKHIVPTCHPDRIKFELDCLKRIGGIDNVAGVDLCLRNRNNVIFIMPFQPHDTFSEYVGKMDIQETAQYIKNLLIALARVHTFNIIHRDVKPSNFLYDRQTKRYLLVDFGLAQKQPEQKNEAGKPETPKETMSGQKRKRDPLSPINGIKQDSKRAFQPQPLNIASTPTNAHHLKLKQMSSQKENNPRKFAAPKQVNLVKFDHSSEIQSSPRGCGCYGKPQICSTCHMGTLMQASRAGTPGFRPPEVLLKYPHQTTAVDMWAAGIILLSILSNCTNFFSCPNDLAALLELVTIFGHDNIKKIANKFGRYFICSEKKPALDIRKICCTLRGRGKQMKENLQGDKCANCGQYVRVCLCPNIPLDKVIRDEFPDEAYDLLKKLLDLNPKTRITAEDALKHPFITNV